MTRPGLLALALLVLPALPAAPAASAPDPERGRQLYENHCLECHTSRVHIRERRKGGDPEAVRAQIRRWRAYLDLEWGAAEVEDVYHHLERRFYRFDEGSDR